MSLRQRILLATDMSARSDRALDRARMLAKRENTELVVLHVIEPGPGNRYYPRTQSMEQLAELARAQLLDDLVECAEKTVIRIEEGDSAETIVRVADEVDATLVVVGVARIERLGRYVLGATVERLVRGLERPLLIVTDRPRRDYERVAVAVDLSPISRHTLELATSLFPGQRITAFHAYQPIATYAASNPEAHREQFRQLAKSELATWLSNAELAPATRDLVQSRIELGDPALRLREVAERGVFDLVIVGTKGRGRIFEFFVGSVAKSILAQLPCDALFVREKS